MLDDLDKPHPRALVDNHKGGWYQQLRCNTETNDRRSLGQSGGLGSDTLTEALGLALLQQPIETTSKKRLTYCAQVG